MSHLHLGSLDLVDDGGQPSPAPLPRYSSGRRVMAVTSWPAASSAAATCRPTNPVAPDTRVFT